MIKALLSRTVFSHTLQCGPEWFILCSDHACFSVRLRPYQGVIWCISAPDMGISRAQTVLFARRESNRRT